MAHKGDYKGEMTAKDYEGHGNDMREDVEMAYNKHEKMEHMEKMVKCMHCGKMTPGMDYEGDSEGDGTYA